MELASLIRHPSSAAAPAISVEAIALILVTGAVSFRYRVRGDVGRVLMPPAGPARRADELWRHTCFEAFVQPNDEDRYVELNFAPSTAWAAYSFEGYRQGMLPLLAIETPAVHCRSNRDSITLEATVHLRSLPCDAAVGLSGVIEDVDGKVSFWALTHPRAKPDFHDSQAWTSAFQREA